GGNEQGPLPLLSRIETFELGGERGVGQVIGNGNHHRAIRGIKECNPASPEVVGELYFLLHHPAVFPSPQSEALAFPVDALLHFQGSRKVSDPDAHGCPSLRW